MCAHHCRLSVIVLALLAAPLALAQWPTDPATNLRIDDRTGDHGMPKVVATSDGGCYISWFDNHTGGYDVRLQHLDAFGYAWWPPYGVLVADRNFSYTTDYSLAVDAGDNAAITYRDDRAGGEQIGANLVAADGTLLWGPSGVLLTNTTEYVANPIVTVTSDGYYIVGWTQENDFVLQKLDAFGISQWVPAVRETPTVGSYTLADLVPGDAGSVMALWVYKTGSPFYADKHLYAQKYAADGTPLWGAGHVHVYDGGTVQFGYFPKCVADGAGGAVFGWYEVSGVRRAYVQHVNVIGAELFPHNGVASSLQADRIALTPVVTYDAVAGDIYLFWVGSNTGQSAWGFFGQRYSPAGARLWTDNGLQLIAMSGDQLHAPAALATPPGATAFCLDGTAADHLLAMRLNPDGTLTWPAAPLHVCTAASSKMRVDAARTPTGVALLAWVDDRNGDNDIYAQNVNPDGTLGARPVCRGDANCDGVINWRDIDYFVAAMNDNVAAWEAMFDPGTPSCLFASNDVDSDGTVNWRDIDPLVAVMNTVCPPVPTAD